LDKSGLRSVYAAAQRSLVTRVNRYRRRRCDLFRGSNQAVVFRVGAARCGVDLSESHDDPSVPIKVKIRLRSLGAVLPESIARRYPCDLRFMLFLFRVEERDHMIQSFRRFA